MIKFSPIIILAAIVVLGVLFYNRKRYFHWVRMHWFFKQSFFSSCNFTMLGLSFVFLLFSLLDVRGPQKQLEIDIPAQKTIIMIDTSSSMLVEDVKPSRFKRSLFMAKHFVKKSIGHQIGIVLFSNIHKRIVPFTDDIDLLDARISGLESLDISRGSSNIGQAIQESLQYFKSSNKDDKSVFGNILIFSDSEETDSSFEVDIPEKINVAFVGVGTLNGGKIPMRSRGGNFRGYKRYNREDVISKLNEDYIKQLGTKVKNYRHWIASSYTIYTDEIIKFFEKSFLEELESSRQAIIRPVWSHYIASLGIIFYILSAIFSQFRSFQKCIIIFFLAIWGAGDGRIWADVSMDLEKLKKGKLDKTQRLKLAEKFLKKNENEKALKLYGESLEDWKNWDFPVLLNYGVALFRNGKIGEGIKVYDYLYQKAGLREEEKSAMRNNLMKILEEQDENRDKKENNGKGDEGKDDKEGERGQDGEKKESEDAESGGSGEGKEEDRERDGGNEKQGDDLEEQEKKEQPNPPKKNMTGREAFKEKIKNMEKQKKLIKIPEKLKSIMNKDRALQDKFFDTSTYTGKRNRQIKDW